MLLALLVLALVGIATVFLAFLPSAEPSVYALVLVEGKEVSSAGVIDYAGATLRRFSVR